jgi:hypothetical protein
MNTITSTQTFQRAIATLTALESQGLAFKVIVGDQEYGKLKSEKPKSKRRFVFRSHGGRNNYLSGLLASMIPGQVEVLAVPDFIGDRAVFAQAISSWCHKAWGKGSTMINSAGNAVEVLRLK